MSAGRGIDLSAVKRTEQPTRDVLVTRTEGGERTFAGFGKAKANGVAALASTDSRPSSARASACKLQHASPFSLRSDGQGA